MESARSDFSDMSRRFGDVLRRINRFADGPMTRKKLVILVLVVTFIFLYLGPAILDWLFGKDYSYAHYDVCQQSFIKPFEEDLKNYDVYLRHENEATAASNSRNYVPYVGNGLIGLALEADSHLNIKYLRTLSLPVYYHPLYIVNDDNMKETTLVEYKKGIVHRFQCSNSGLQASYQYYAHRTIPSVFVQEILVNNPTNAQKSLKLSTPRVSDWSTSVKQTIKLHQGSIH